MWDEVMTQKSGRQKVLGVWLTRIGSDLKGAAEGGRTYDIRGDLSASLPDANPSPP